MASGLLSLFEDPVVGPQIALGLLSSGIGTMFSPRDKLNEALQGGLGHIGQALYYGGRQKAKQAEEEQKLAAQQASAEEFGRALESLGGGGGGAPPVAPSAPSYTPGMGMPPLAPVAQQGAPMGPGPGHHSRIGPEAALLLKTAFSHPENARALGPAITQLMQPEKLTEAQEMQQLIDMAGLNKEQGQTVVRRKIDYLPTSEWDGTHNALSKYQEMSLAQQQASSAAANADRDARLAWDQRKGAGGGVGKLEKWQITAEALGYAPGSPGYVKMGNIAGGIEPRAQNTTPIYNDKGEITGYIGGQGSKPLTEQESKFLLHGEEIASANKAMDDLQSIDPKTGQKKAGAKDAFDPTSNMGAADVALAGNPYTRGLASEEAQQQYVANEKFSTALSYGRSQASWKPEEKQAAYDVFLEQRGDKPATKASKRAARYKIERAILSGNPRLPQMVAELTGGVDFVPEGGVPKTAAGAGIPGSMEMAPAEQAAPAARAESPEDLFKRLSGM